MNLRMSSKGRLLVDKAAGIDRDALLDWESDVIEGDRIDASAIQWMQNQPFTGAVTQQMLQLQSDIKMDSGQNQFTRGETTNNIVSGKAITALQSAGGKIQQMRTSVMNAGFKKIVKQVLWLMAEFYGSDRVTMVVGKNGKTRRVESNAERFFGVKTKGAVAPPAYTVQVEIASRDPARIDSINNMYMQAYTMAAQAKQFFPLSALFQMMNVEGKDRLLPVIRENEQTQQIMQQQQQQLEQLQQQLEQANKANENLRLSNAQMSNALSNVSTSGATSGFTPQAAGTKAAQAGGGPNTKAALVDRSRMMLGGMAEEA